MCGIIGVWLTESVPNISFWEKLVEGALLRGTDGFGITIIDPEKREVKVSYKDTDMKNLFKIYDMIEIYAKIGNIVMIQTRNAPETEEYTTNPQLHIQPVNVDGFIYVHNGGIADHHVKEYKDHMKTEIDSEVIGLAYIKHNRRFKDALESLSGSWSLFGYDIKKNRILIATSWLPAGHGYLRGTGYVFHSYWTYIQKSFADIKHLKDPEDLRYMRIWEDFYFHELPGFSIYEIDVDSGLVTPYTYKHKFIHPTWKQENGNKSKYLVLASGGIDSTTTALFLKKELRVDVELVHFNYGQKSQEAEELAVKKIAKHLDIPYKVFDIRNIYKEISTTSSMLINPDIEITTGNDDMKTVAAWVPFRNALMLSIVTAYAEELILTNQYDKVYVCGGFPVISESGGGYPDNSEKFIDAYHDFVRYGSIAGVNRQIRYINPFEGLTKREELILMKHYDESLFGLTVSCDDAKVINNEILQCACTTDTETFIRKDDEFILPACGSGLLSYIAATQAGIDPNTRKFYTKCKCDDILSEKYINKQIYQIPYTVYDILDIIQRVKKTLEDTR